MQRSEIVLVELLTLDRLAHFSEIDRLRQIPFEVGCKHSYNENEENASDDSHRLCVRRGGYDTLADDVIESGAENDGNG